MSAQEHTKDLVCDHEPGFPVTLLHATGALTLITVAELRRAGMKALTDQPELLVVDVSAMVAVDDIALTALPMLARQGTETSTGLIVAGPGPALRGQLERMGIARQVPVVATLADALAEHERRPGPRRLDLELAPAPGATAQARALVDRACGQWRLPHLADHAALIVTELVANAVQHAGTRIRLSVTLRRRHLHVAVRDASPRPLRRSGGDEQEPGRGLLVVEGLAAAWGCMYTGGGKVVWATLRQLPWE
ncbi:ATP-binding protein [Dactylosporangium sp. CA-092794]|uniref:ATP-binding protein n=1 Tax=Dactylosporangium sp. CA-092794 TaxID=3239929 RepID=UPI003D8BE2D1